MNTKIYQIPAINCVHCIHTIKTELSELEGVKYVDGKLEEKQTDVNLALHAVKDALLGDIEHVVIVTNDTDIAPALNMIRAHTKAVIGLVIPTTDHERIPNAELGNYAHWVRTHITEVEPKLAQLP